MTLNFEDTFKTGDVVWRENEPCVVLYKEVIKLDYMTYQAKVFLYTHNKLYVEHFCVVDIKEESEDCTIQDTSYYTEVVEGLQHLNRILNTAEHKTLKDGNSKTKIRTRC